MELPSGTACKNTDKMPHLIVIGGIFTHRTIVIGYGTDSGLNIVRKAVICKKKTENVKVFLFPKLKCR